jgi:hypothetical protein
MSSIIIAQDTTIPWGISQVEYRSKFGDQYNTTYKGLDFLICNDSIKGDLGLYKTLELNAFARLRLVKRTVILWEHYGNVNDITALRKYCVALTDISGRIDSVYGKSLMGKIWFNNTYKNKTDEESIAKATISGQVKYYQEWNNKDTKVTLSMGCPNGDGEIIFVIQYYGTSFKDIYTGTTSSPDDWGI